jgi:hypothetical protein
MVVGRSCTNVTRGNIVALVWKPLDPTVSQQWNVLSL